MPLGATAKREYIDLPLQSRAANVQLSTINAEERSVEVVWTTGAQVRRYDYWRDQEFIEELSTDPAHVRIGRLNGGAPLLDSHRSWGLDAVLGSVVQGSARIKPGEGTARVRFVTGDEDTDKVWNKVQQGAVRAISVGYRVYKFEEQPPKDGVRVFRAVDWEPFEISFVPIGADPDAGARSESARAIPCEVEMKDVTTKDNPANTHTAADVDAARKAGDGEGYARGTKYASEILDLVMLGRGTIADVARFIKDGKTVDEVRAALVEKRNTEADSQPNVRGAIDPENMGTYKRGALADGMRTRFKN